MGLLGESGAMDDAARKRGPSACTLEQPRASGSLTEVGGGHVEVVRQPGETRASGSVVVEQDPHADAWQCHDAPVHTTHAQVGTTQVGGGQRTRSKNSNAYSGRAYALSTSEVVRILTNETNYNM